MPGRADRPARWCEADLLARVEGNLALAARAVDVLVAGGASPLAAKVVAETAMLVHVVAPLRHHSRALAHALDALAAHVAPHTRTGDRVAGICLDPGHALDHASGHVMLAASGYPDPTVDGLLSLALQQVGDLGPERLPHRELELQWLRRLHGEPVPTATERAVVARSALARPVDALASTREDVYAFTHALMYVSDLGRRPVAGGRPRAALRADAEAALAYAMDSVDHDLCAEVLFAWPMLGLPWTPVAAVAFQWLAHAEDETGHLRGLGYDPEVAAGLGGASLECYVLSTSYHTAYVMAMLCAAVVASGRRPPRIDPTSALWREARARLALTASLRHAVTRGDLDAVASALDAAVRDGLACGPAVAQAVALLRRAGHLAAGSRRQEVSAGYS